jgi:hypothetical protein
MPRAKTSGVRDGWVSLVAICQTRRRYRKSSKLPRERGAREEVHESVCRPERYGKARRAPDWTPVCPPSCTAATHGSSRSSWLHARTHSALGFGHLAQMEQPAGAVRHVVLVHTAARARPALPTDREPPSSPLGAFRQHVNAAAFV